MQTRRRTQPRKIEFRATPAGDLERYVELAGPGEAYAQRCSERVFRQVAAWLDDHPAEITSVHAVARAIDAPQTQTYVALELLGERGIFERAQGRKSWVAPGYRHATFEHAMTEFYAIIEGCPPKIVIEDL